MTREEFCKKIVLLLLYIQAKGYRYIIGEVWRGEIQQLYYYLTKRSKCDGIKNRSSHQDGKAIDIWLLDKNGKIDWDKKKYEELHQFWQSLGGKPMIEWDLGHFEG